MEQKMMMMGQECDEIAQAFMMKKQIYKDQIKALKLYQKDYHEVQTIREQLKEAEKLIQEM